MNVDTICAAIPQVALKRCVAIKEKAQAVANKFGKALSLFLKCHNLVNSSNFFKDTDLSTLSKLIDFT